MQDKNLIFSVYPSAICREVKYGSSTYYLIYEGSQLISYSFFSEEDAWLKIDLQIKLSCLRILEA